MRHRTRDQIIAAVLQSAAIEGGITKTRIMYSSFLSYSQLLEYLDFMTGNNLLKYDAGNKVYKPTDTGMQLLNLTNRINSMLKDSNGVSVPSIVDHRLEARTLPTV